METISDAARDRRAIGRILVEHGKLNQADVEPIQEFAKKNAIQFGEAAKRLRRLTDSDIDLAIAEQFSYPALSRVGDRGVTDDVVAGYLGQSKVVEPLRDLRSQIRLRWKGKPGRRILAVASPARGDGRSWIAANLATVFAQMGDRTLLVDANMRYPRQHLLFKVDNRVGLSALLTGRAGREIIAHVHPQLPLFVLPVGMLPPNPQELLGRQVCTVVLDSLAAQYDLVIVDTPAATDSADAQILTARAGAALMVLRRNHTRHAHLAATMLTLTASGVDIIGNVINQY